jgi:hypothetical protein
MQQQRKIIQIASLCIAVAVVISTFVIFLPRGAKFPGMDEAVNVNLADSAGIPARKPYLNVEEWGDLWNLMLLLGGGVCGFVVGRNWDHIWGRPR